MESCEKILEFLYGADDGDDFFNWLHSLPQLEQVDVLDEYRAIVNEVNPNPDNSALNQRLAEIEPSQIPTRKPTSTPSFSASRPRWPRGKPTKPSTTLPRPS